MRKRPKQALYAVPSGEVPNNKVPANTPAVSQTHNGTINRTHQTDPGGRIDTATIRVSGPSTVQFKGKWDMPGNPYGSTSFQPAMPQSSYHPPGNKATQQSRKIQPAKLLPQNHQNHFQPRGQSQYQRFNEPVIQNTYQPVLESRSSFQPQQRPNQRYSSSFSARPSTSGTSSLQPNTFKFSKKDEFKPRPMGPSLVTSAKTDDKKAVQQKTLTPDEMMRILTLSVEGIKKWSQILADDGMLMFEVYGLLSTDVDSSRGAKKFMLKDGSHTLQCIFYETDRPMPQVTRGQWVRCVGIFQRNVTTLQCVSVRPVEQAEQRWMKQQMGACEKALKSQLAAVKMEP